MTVSSLNGFCCCFIVLLLSFFANFRCCGERVVWPPNQFGEQPPRFILPSPASFQSFVFLVSCPHASFLPYRTHFPTFQPILSPILTARKSWEYYNPSPPIPARFGNSLIRNSIWCTSDVENSQSKSHKCVIIRQPQDERNIGHPLP